MRLKVHSTIVISSIVGFVLIAAEAGISITALVNAFAQEGFQTEDLVNETIDMGNNTTSNATLVLAQEEEREDKGGTTDDGDTNMTDGLGNDTGGMSEGQTDPNGEATDLGTGGP